MKTQKEQTLSDKIYGEMLQVLDVRDFIKNIEAVIKLSNSEDSDYLVKELHKLAGSKLT